jgi:hypothetical protein
VTANGLALGGTVSNVFPIGVGTLYSGVQAVADTIGYRLPVSLGDSQAVVSANINNSVTIGSCPTHGVTIGNTSVTVNGTFWQATQPVSLASVPAHAVTLTSTTVTVSSLPALSAGTAQIGSVTASFSGTPSFYPIQPPSPSSRLCVTLTDSSGTSEYGTTGNSLKISGSVTIGAGTAQIGSVTASISGTVPVSGTFWQATQPVSLASVPALAAGTNQIGSVTASITGTVPVSGTFYQATQPVSLASLPALAAGSAQIGAVTVSAISSTVTVASVQGSSATTTTFTSVTASTSIVAASSSRKALTIFNEGFGNLYISPTATCTTVSYQVRLASGDYWNARALKSRSPMSAFLHRWVRHTSRRSPSRVCPSFIKT